MLDSQQPDLSRHIARSPDALGLGHHGIGGGHLRGHTGLIRGQAGMRRLDHLMPIMQRFEQGPGDREVVHRREDHQPVKAKKKWNGNATTPVMLCRSSALRWVRLRGRKVKNSLKILRLIIRWVLWLVGDTKLATNAQ